ncbi:MAG: BACON domain-containing protein [Bacteroidales bacterium]|nr:BACON domain-containing protein [Bacteroidales bacterium]
MMKKITYIAIAVLSTILAVACQPEQLEVVREIQLSQTDVQIGAQGASVKVVYQIGGAESGAVVSVSNDAEWLSVSTGLPRLIEITASRNESGAEREAVLAVSYPGYEDVTITVSQSVWETPITLTINETEATAIIFSVTTAEDGFGWVGQVVGKEWFDDMESDDAIFQEDLSYYSLQASNENISLQDYLKTIINKGSFSNLKYKGLDPSSEYVVYVYGITEDGERTTDIYSAAATTLPPYDGPISFEIRITEENSIMDVTVTPDHDGVYYYWNLMDCETYDSYASLHGDDPKEVFQAYVNWDIQDLIDYEYLTTRAEYFEWYSDINEVNSQFECMALTEYIVFACKWDEDCNFTGEPVYEWYTSSDVAPSDNQFTVTIGDDVDQSSFFVDVKTANNDPYVMLAEPSVFMEGMNEDQIYAHLIEDYGAFGLNYYVFEGDVAGRMTGLQPDTEYTLVVFGFKAGKKTTAMQTFTVKTLSAGPAEDCTFDFVLDKAESNALHITVTPSDAAHYYYWYVYSLDTTADDVREDVTNLINKTYYGDMYEFSYYELSQGRSTGNIPFLAPETQYKVAAVVMDPRNGEFLADVIFSEPFSTGEENYSDITITATFDKFYDGDDLYAVNPNAGAQYQGYAMVPVTVTIDGEYSSYYYTIFEYVTGLENPEKYPDAALYQTLVYYGVNYSESVNFRAPWNKAVVIAALAIDTEGRYSRVYRQKYTFRKYNASPISDLLTKSLDNRPAVKVPYALPEMKVELIKDRQTGDDRFSAAKMEQVRRENRIRKF